MDRAEFIRKANKTLIEKGDLSAIGVYFDPEYIAYAGEKMYCGHDFIERFVQQLRKSIPDVRVLNVEVLLEHGNRLAWQRTLQGTHIETMRGIPPSNKQIKWREMLVSHFEGDKITEEWLVSDLASQLFSKQA